jgi:hypothetical protein
MKLFFDFLAGATEKRHATPIRQTPTFDIEKTI